MEKTKAHKTMNKKAKTELQIQEIETLNKNITNQLPPTGKYSVNTNPQSAQINSPAWEKPYEKFCDLPISSRTLKGLSETRYINLTPVQRATLPHALAGRDILGASKTGSGKTLCFLIPVLENLYRLGFVKEEGLGALIILPTRELAMQIFEVVNKVGRHHNFSVGLVIGGNNLLREQAAVGMMNILIGTPGRILQHMGETPYFNSDNLKLLVIDEADRILDEGFEDDLTKLLSYLPKSRQTLLFSATLTKNLKRLGKVHMRSPEYINLSGTDSVLAAVESINKNELSFMKANMQKGLEQINELIIPRNLNQLYAIVEPEERINVLYSFLKLHKACKCLVFLSSRKQVRYFAEVFKRLKLGMLFLDIHGKQKQGRRASTFYTFAQKRSGVVLFATDVASRGVDFPAIDWVVQLDAPEDISQYIHRVGRTARYKSVGNSVLFLSKAEEPFIDELTVRKIVVKKMKIPDSKVSNLVSVVRSILSEHAELIEAAEKAVSSYVKAVHLFSNKKIFDVGNIDISKLAISYGLVSTPSLVVKSRGEVEKEKDAEYKEYMNSVKLKEKEENEVLKGLGSERKKSKLQKLKEKIKNKKLLKKQEAKIDDDFLEVKEKKEKKEEKLLKKKRKKSEEKADESINSDSENEEAFYDKIKNKLNANKEKDKIKEKARILMKHKEDRIKAKEKDYKKHGLLLEEEEENEMNDSQSSVKEEEISRPKEPKIKIALSHSTLKEKENAALELLKRKNMLFQ